MAEEKTKSVAKEEAVSEEKGATTEAMISSEMTGKAATTAEAVDGGPVKIKCNTTTSCDTTIPWGE